MQDNIINIINRISLVLFWALAAACNNPQSISTGVTKPAESIQPSKDQSDRRKHSEQICIIHKIPIYTNPNALFTDREDDVTIRSKKEIIDRILALYYTGLKGEGLEEKYLVKIASDYDIKSKLSPSETMFVANPNPTQQQKSDATWRYESLHVMLWALGYVDSLNYPDKMCNVQNDFKFINHKTFAVIEKGAKLRSKKEILDQADLILRFDWACVNARLKEQSAPGNLNKEVVYEWHYALNWLINYSNLAWDDVTTDT